MALLGWSVASGAVLPAAAATGSNPPLAIPPSGAFFGAFADAGGRGRNARTFCAAGVGERAALGHGSGLTRCGIRPSPALRPPAMSATR